MAGAEHGLWGGTKEKFGLSPEILEVGRGIRSGKV
jgi:hypothetical protein